jgi:hypothetical protein
MGRGREEGEHQDRVVSSADCELPWEQKISAYSKIDPILTAWARERGVHVYTHYRDVEVRSILTWYPSDEQRHMYLSPPDASDQVGLHAAVSGGWRHDRIVPLDELAVALNEVYDLMMDAPGPSFL